MGKFDHFMLASDIDSTFVWQGGYIPPENLEAVEYFKAHGGKFSFASGRNHHDYRIAIPGDPATFASMPYVLCNGSYLYDANKKEILNPHYLPANAAKELYAYVHKTYPQVGIRASYIHGFLVLKDDEYVHNMLISSGLGDLMNETTQEEFDGTGLYKTVITHTDTDLLHTIGQELAQKMPDAFTITTSSPHILEVLPKNVNKGEQLTYLKNLYKQEDPDIQLWCAGDFDNDIEMLQIADVAACPSNATNQVKSICKYEVCHCKDGAIAEIIALMEKQ